MTILALVCFLVAGAAAASILGRDSVPSVRSEIVPAIAKGPASNREGKKDKLPLAMAALPPAAADNPQVLLEPLRQAFASDSPFGPQPPKIAAPVTAIPRPAEKPKAAAKPPVQKSYALLSDIQIAGIKERLKLSAAQEQHWPGVETALRAIARKIHETRQANPAANTPVDPEWTEVQQLKSVAMPLLFQLREDQKREVRSLAHIIGLGSVASLI
jgi:hypothetical protein